MALEEKFRKLTVDSLKEQHRVVIVRVVSNLLSTEIAELTFAQIVDRLPLAEVTDDTYNNGAILSHIHPLYTEHTQLCPGVLETTRKFRADFNLNILQFDCRLIYAYEAASPGSTAFKTRLIEMVAVAMYQIAVQLFKRDKSLHMWTPPKDDTTFSPHGAPPTLFRHEWYGDYDQYPDGVADMVGYWAEARILGGVVLFDRNESRSESIFFHSDRDQVTYRVYSLLPHQKLQFLQFLLSVEPTSSPFPILGDDRNVNRVDPEESIESTGIYRDIWERKPLSLDAADMRRRDVYDSLDYPTMNDFQQAQERAANREEAKYR